MNIGFLISNLRKIFLVSFICRSWCLGALMVQIGFVFPVFADVDALSGPEPDSTPHLSIPKPVPLKTVTPLRKKKNHKKKSEVKPTPTATMTATPVVTPTTTASFTPTMTVTPDKNSKKTPTPTPTPKPIDHGTGKAPLPKVTTIPNPVWGDKVIFRVMTSGAAKAHIVIYDRFFNKVDELEGEGDRLFDILWSLKKIPEGIYYYQSQIDDTQAGISKTLSMQNFAVMKDEAPQP